MFILYAISYRILLKIIVNISCLLSRFASCQFFTNTKCAHTFFLWKYKCTKWTTKHYNKVYVVYRLQNVFAYNTWINEKLNESSCAVLRSLLYSIKMFFLLCTYARLLIYCYVAIFVKYIYAMKSIYFFSALLQIVENGILNIYVHFNSSWNLYVNIIAFITLNNLFLNFFPFQLTLITFKF